MTFKAMPETVRQSLSLGVLCLLLISCATAFSFTPANAQGYSSERPSGRYMSQSSYCRDLERKLASDWVRGSQANNPIPEINAKIRKQDKLFNRLQNKADRMDCYENMFIFGRSLRRTKRCLNIDRKIRSAKKQLSRLRQKRDSVRDSRTTGDRRQRLIEELARNRCGEQYQREARRSNSNSWFGESGLGEFFGNNRPYRSRRREDSMPTGIQPYATYRTMCVRTCDGFYFPISFSTLPSNFPKDTDLCQSKCAAPAELYVYRNPGGEVEQMISPRGEPYDGLQNAWRYRKEYIKGCSCKETEYSQIDIEAHNNPVSKTDNSTVPTPKTTKISKSPSDTDVPALPTRRTLKKARTIEDLIR